MSGDVGTLHHVKFDQRRLDVVTCCSWALLFMPSPPLRSPSPTAPPPRHPCLPPPPPPRPPHDAI